MPKSCEGEPQSISTDMSVNFAAFFHYYIPPRHTSITLHKFCYTWIELAPRWSYSGSGVEEELMPLLKDLIHLQYPPPPTPRRRLPPLGGFVYPHECQPHG